MNETTPVTPTPATEPAVAAPGEVAQPAPEETKTA